MPAASQGVIYVKERDTTQENTGPFPQTFFRPGATVHRDFNHLDDRHLTCMGTLPCGTLIVNLGFKRKGSLSSLFILRPFLVLQTKTVGADYRRQ